MGLIVEPSLADIPTELRPVTRLAPVLPDVDIDPANPGFACNVFYVMVLPIRPPKKAGEIELVDVTRANMNVLCTIGQVLAVGPLAFDERRGFEPGAREQYAPGKWVAFHAYSGQELRVQEADGRGLATVRLMKDQDILLAFDTPEAAQAFAIIP